MKVLVYIYSYERYDLKSICCMGVWVSPSVQSVGSRPRRERPEWRERDGGEERDRGLRDRRYHTLSGTLAPEMDTAIKLQFVFT